MKYGFCSQLGPTVYFKPYTAYVSIFLNKHQIDMFYTEVSDLMKTNSLPCS
jgi:hypothetical protein